MQRKQKTKNKKKKKEKISRSLREKHLTNSVKIKIDQHGHGMLQDTFESLTLWWVNISS
jgi:hypothetical protein